MANQVESILNLPAYAVYGLQVSNNATTPNTQVDISAGACRDSLNNVDLVLGSKYPNAEGSYVSAPLTIDATVVGANGIDAGSLAASKVYAVYLIGDSRGYKTIAGLLSLASNSAPTMPFDYDSYRLIGYVVTDASVHFLAGQIFGNGNDREWRFDTAQATAVTAGAATSPTNVDLSALMPNQENALAMISYDFSANAAGDELTLRSLNSGGAQFLVEAQAAAGTAHLQGQGIVPVELNSGAPTLKYSVSAGAVALDVAGFKYSL